MTGHSRGQAIIDSYAIQVYTPTIFSDCSPFGGISRRGNLGCGANAEEGRGVAFAPSFMGYAVVEAPCRIHQEGAQDITSSGMSCWPVCACRTIHYTLHMPVCHIAGLTRYATRPSRRLLRMREGFYATCVTVG